MEQCVVKHRSHWRCLISSDVKSSHSQTLVETDHVSDYVHLRSRSISPGDNAPFHDDKALQISNVVLKHCLHHRLPQVLLTESLDGN